MGSELALDFLFSLLKWKQNEKTRRGGGYGCELRIDFQFMTEMAMAMAAAVAVTTAVSYGLTPNFCLMRWTSLMETAMATAMATAVCHHFSVT